jgi:hypothetical protein
LGKLCTNKQSFINVCSPNVKTLLGKQCAQLLLSICIDSFLQAGPQGPHARERARGQHFGHNVVRLLYPDVSTRPGSLVQRMKDLLHCLCNSLFVQHKTLPTLAYQKMLNQEIRTKPNQAVSPLWIPGLAPSCWMKQVCT